MKNIHFRAMGCQMSAFIDGSTNRAKSLLQQVPDWFEEWEQALSRFRLQSELNRVNQRSGESVVVSELFWEVLEQSVRMEHASHGLVTPLVLPALEIAGYVDSFENIPDSADVMLDMESGIVGSLNMLVCDPLDHSIHLPFGCRLDFGGVAKGWAAHQAMRRLANYAPALVNAGGDISVSSLRREGSPWRIGIVNPFEPENDLGSVQVGRCGVATSGRDYRKWMRGGMQRHHIIDPRSGQPAETDLISVTVIAPNVMEAEMAAKTILILGSHAGQDWLETQSHLAVILVFENGQVQQTSNMQLYGWRE